ncbi:hypothetical protein UO65_0579 [Actinokineospora spheciospongiae]|uniref:Transmembrane protein n=1 Tax=Actinokineospora spheciospongiae TaxID=909613 RepID=W7J4W5_9PSEU|nr:hypothetical protein [Actinokineospora spheciospongiae]EWC64052.1 hypothetical protein UO65_0579 [Actinokineospora spheciospongiae]PWW58403.1 hypothetical protein DFQ13_109196 [Actinokineospora spheciospongiae]
MKGRPGDGPEDVDAAFAEIVADLRREGVGLSLPSEAEVKRDRSDAGDEPAAAPPPAPSSPPVASTWRNHETDIDWADDNADEHYEPPEPPPLPRPHGLTIAAFVAIAAGVALLVLAATVLSTAWTPVGLACVALGVGTLLMRARKTPRDDEDSGAQV